MGRLEEEDCLLIQAEINYLEECLSMLAGDDLKPENMRCND